MLPLGIKVLKTASKTEGATGDLIGSKIRDKITNASKSLKKKKKKIKNNLDKTDIQKKPIYLQKKRQKNIEN